MNIEYQCACLKKDIIQIRALGKVRYLVQSSIPFDTINKVLCELEV